MQARGAGVRWVRRSWWRSAEGRKFAQELWSIVLGVLIALGLGAIAGEIGWWLEVRSARAVISVELGEVMGQARERERITGCYRQRLTYLARALDRGAETGRLPPVADIGSPAFRTWSRGAWESTLSAQTASHFDRDELDNLSGAYEFQSLLSDTNRREMDAWAKLLTMVGPGRRLSDAEEAQLRLALGEARLLNNLMGMAAVRLAQVVDAYDLPVDRGDVVKYGGLPLSTYGFCQPLGAVPPSYEAAPLPFAVEHARANPITRDNIGIGMRRR